MKISDVTPEIGRCLMDPKSKLHGYYWSKLILAPGKLFQEACEAYWESFGVMFKARDASL